MFGAWRKVFDNGNLMMWRGLSLAECNRNLSKIGKDKYMEISQKI